MAADIETIIPIVQKYINDVKNAMPIDKVFLYGSFANGTQKKDSDVDICFFSKSLNPGEILIF